MPQQWRREFGQRPLAPREGRVGGAVSGARRRPGCSGSDRGGRAGIAPELQQRRPRCVGSETCPATRATGAAKPRLQSALAPGPVHVRGRRVFNRATHASPSAPRRRLRCSGTCLSHPPALRLGSLFEGRVGGAVSGARRRRPGCSGSDRGGRAGIPPQLRQRRPKCVGGETCPNERADEEAASLTRPVGWALFWRQPAVVFYS